MAGVPIQCTGLKPGNLCASVDRSFIDFRYGCGYDDAQLLVREQRAKIGHEIMTTESTLPIRSGAGSARTPSPRTVSDVDKLIGHNVRIIRTSKGISQDKLGELIGVTFQQVQKYEKGVNRIAFSTMLRIAEALDEPVTMFSRDPNAAVIGEAVEVDATRATFYEDSDRDDARLLTVTRLLDPEQKKRLVDLMTAMVRPDPHH